MLIFMDGNEVFGYRKKTRPSGWLFGIGRLFKVDSMIKFCEL